MSESEYRMVSGQLETLRQLERDYGHKTLRNVMDALASRLGYHRERVGEFERRQLSLFEDESAGGTGAC